MKIVIKAILRGIARLCIIPCWMIYILFGMFSQKDKVFFGFSQLFSLLPGTVGIYLRREFYRMTLCKCSNDCNISFGVLIGHKNTEINESVYIGSRSTLGTVCLEKNVLIGSDVNITSGTRQHSFERIDVPIKDQHGNYEKVTVGEDSWIGNNATILANIGKKCIVGAGSVVVDEVEKLSIVAGNPAKVIKKRDEDY
ncbi:acyltransferase [Chlamydiota bacterium]